MVFEKRLSLYQERYLKNLAKLYVPGSNIIIPPLFNQNIYMSFLMRMIVSVLIVAFTLMNIFTSFRYLIIMRKDEFAIYRICGGKSRCILVIIGFEVVAICLFSYIAGIFLFLIAKPRLELFTTAFFEIKICEYILCFAAVLLISALSILKTALKTVTSKEVTALLF